jgi:2-dehydro-3-deoxygalactonokinase
MSRLLAIDWGSTAMRGALLDEASGAVIEERACARGLLNLGSEGFEGALRAEFGDWLARAGVRCLMAGMVGSRQGWVEAPYVPCPAGLGDFVARLHPVPFGAGESARDLAIVPGACCEHDGVPDVLRGEEVKFLGAIETLAIDDATVLSPGTHSKWATIEQGRLVRFTTTMSGELYALLRHQSILARSLPAEDGALDGAAFDDGVRRALAGAGLLQTAFSVRSLALFERMTPAALASYLSGLVIGEAVRWPGLAGVPSVIVVGAPVLTERFARALALRGVATQILDEAAAWRGLWAIDRARRAVAPKENRS